MLSAMLAVVDHRQKKDALILFIQLMQFDDDLLVIAIADPGAVVAGEPNRTAWVMGRFVEYHIAAVILILLASIFLTSILYA
jgi:hypothetical protein